MRSRLYAVAALATLFSAASIADTREPGLPAGLSRALAQSGVPAAHVSIYVRDAGTDELALELNAETPRSPASTIKVLTTFAALDLLGPGYTWKTRAYVDGRIDNGVLNGDLVLVGGGDPYMTSDRWWSFVQELRERGLQRIAGDVVIDNSYFAPVDGDRAAFDGQAFRSYNVLPDALMVNFQTARFTIANAAQDGRPVVTVNPQPANLVIDNRLKIDSGRCRGYHRGVRFRESAEQPNSITLAGAFPDACRRYSINRAIMSAPEYAYGVFRTMWLQSGGEIDGGLRLGAASDQARLLHEHESLPLPEIIRLVNKYSNNVMARHLMLTIGAEKFGAPATSEAGRTAVHQWLLGRGVFTDGLAIDNGSGLSRSERIAARTLGEMLDGAWHSAFMPEFAASLPLAAIDGTLRQRFDAPGMQGRLRLKTGRIDDVSGLAGYVNAASGRTFVLVVIINHPGAHAGAADAIQTELVRWVFAQ